MDIADSLKSAVARLAEKHISSARLDAELIMAQVLGTERSWLIAHSDKILAKSENKQFQELLDLRLNRTPLAYLVGTKEFYGRDFTVTPNVLIPRPETERLIEFIKGREAQRILDVGTGSGDLAITLALEMPATSVTASDISESALAVAQKNARSLNAKVDFVQSDLLENINGQFDIIVANLPYVAHNQKVSPETAAEPKLALFADDDGLALINKLIVQSTNHLSNNGLLVLEMDPRQIEATAEFARKHRFKVLAKEPFLLALRIIN